MTVAAKVAATVVIAVATAVALDAAVYGGAGDLPPGSGQVTPMYVCHQTACPDQNTTHSSVHCWRPWICTGTAGPHGPL